MPYEIEYVEGQLGWWKCWRDAKKHQKLVSEAQFDEAIKTAEEIIGQHERRLRFLAEEK